MWNLEEKSLLYGDVPFRAFKEENTGHHYFSNRIPTRGVLDFGLVSPGTSQAINLAENGVTSTVLAKSVYCLSPQQTEDTVMIEVYDGTDINKVNNRLGMQYYHHGQMPIKFPDIVLFPQHTITVRPAQQSHVLIYVEPVTVAFYANVTL